MLKRATFKKIGRHGLKTTNQLLAAVDKQFIAVPQSTQPPLFIVGVPRAGTTLAYQIITYHFQVAYFTPVMNVLYGMPNLQFRLYKPFLKRPKPMFRSNYGQVQGWFTPAETGPIWSRWFPWHGENSHYVPASDTTKNPQQYQQMKRNLDSVAAIMQKPVVIKCVYLSMVVTLLSQLFPMARFIHIRRDLLMTIQSLYVGRQKQANPQQWWSVKPPQYQQIRQKPLWQQVVEQAYFTDMLITKELAQFANGRSFQMNYADLCRHPHQKMAALATWLEDVGYQPYATSDLPESFPVSNHWRLDQELHGKMKTHLIKLSTMEPKH